MRGSRGSCRRPAWRSRIAARRGLAVAAVLALGPSARAQTIEPRLFSNAPVGVNFVLVGYTRSSGGFVLDASIPLEDATIEVHGPLLAYVRSIDVAGRSGKIQLLAPYAWLSGEAVLTSTGQVATRDVDGFGDPSVRFSVNLHGAPAMSLAEFGAYHQDLVVGVSLQVSAPLGQYDPDRLVNLGTNRWSFKPEFGLSKRLGRWIVEGTGAVNFYTDNDDFFGGQHREQDPVYSAQGHVIYNFPRAIWIALDGTYYTGGRSTVDGVEGDDLQRNWRFGLTLALPADRRNSIKFYFSDGIYTRTGNDFLLAGVGWQYRWGAGL